MLDLSPISDFEVEEWQELAYKELRLLACMDDSRRCFNLVPTEPLRRCVRARCHNGPHVVGVSGRYKRVLWHAEFNTDYQGNSW